MGIKRPHCLPPEKPVCRLRSNRTGHGTMDCFKIGKAVCEVCLAKAMIFPLVIYGCEIKTIKRVENWIIDAFELWCWIRLLRVQQGNQTIQSWRKSVLNVHWEDWCWSWSSNTLATWWEELTHWKRPWCWERLKARDKGTTENEMVGWHHQLDGHEFEHAPGVGDGQGSLACCHPWGHKKSDMTERMNWRVLKSFFFFLLILV